MPRPITVLVAGATGRQGGAVSNQLLHRGHRVRAFTRRPEGNAARALRSAGAEICGGDLADHGSVWRAARGADAFFLVASPFEQGVHAEIRQATIAAQAARAAGIRHLVYSSVAAANRETGVPHYESKASVELFVRELGVPYTIVAPTFFMENLLEEESLRALRTGWLWLPLPAGRPLQLVSLRDLARFVVLALERPTAFRDRRIDVAADERSAAQMASTLCAVTRSAIGHTRGQGPGVGALGEDRERMFEWLGEAGFDADLRALRRAYPEVGWQDFAGWARTQDWSVLDEAGAEQPTA
jgi:uncharacterized protein YbjT (DUF2867 family)